LRLRRAPRMEMFRQIAAVVAVLGLLWGALWWLRRKGMVLPVTPGRVKRTRCLESLERLALTPQHSLHLVRVSEKVVLIALSPSGCTLLEGVSCSELSVRTGGEVR